MKKDFFYIANITIHLKEKNIYLIYYLISLSKKCASEEKKKSPLGDHQST